MEILDLTVQLSIRLDSGKVVGGSSGNCGYPLDDGLGLDDAEVGDLLLDLTTDNLRYLLHEARRDARADGNAHA